MLPYLTQKGTLAVPALLLPLNTYAKSLYSPLSPRITENIDIVGPEGKSLVNTCLASSLKFVIFCSCLI